MAPAGRRPRRTSVNCRVFPRRQRSFTPSAVSPCGPPPLLLPGCGGPAPCAITGHGDSPPPGLRRRERTARWRFLWCPRFASLGQLGSRAQLPGPDVETSQPHEHCPRADVSRTNPRPVSCGQRSDRDHRLNW
jgi:hypothetical protein